jgi:TonB family protein
MSAPFRPSAKMPNSRTLAICLALAFFVEAGSIYLSGVRFTFPIHHKEAPDVPTEVDVVTIPEETPRLKSESAPAAPAPAEETLSEKPKAGVATKSLSAPTGNIVQKGKPMSATHGPVLIESPAPIIPDYLKNRDLNTKVLIEFIVRANGVAEPKLLVSSGDEELDQIALATAKKWTFYPAENEHKPVDAKIRLRILFTVK